MTATGSSEAGQQMLRIGVITVSDTRDMATDRSGAILVERLEGAGHMLSLRLICRDDTDEIRRALDQCLAAPSDVVITTGGTGFTPRDVTPEAIIPVLDRLMDGFSVYFHQISARSVGSSTIQSRAFAGQKGESFVFCLPGSPGACRDAWDAIISGQLDSRHRPCNLVEILRRTREGS